jgi:hypothetical protein
MSTQSKIEFKDNNLQSVDWKLIARIQSQSFCRSLISGDTYYVYSLPDILQAIQYLQPQGYDLPHYLLDGQTLQQAGLAVYKTK